MENLDLEALETLDKNLVWIKLIVDAVNIPDIL